MMVRLRYFVVLLVLFSLVLSGTVLAAEDTSGDDPTADDASEPTSGAAESGASETTVECSEPISEDTTLDGNMVCSSSGLSIVTDGVTLDCQGYSISGSGSDIGITVSSVENVNIVNCHIENFLWGIYVYEGNYLQVSGGSISQNNKGMYISSGDGVTVSGVDDFSDNQNNDIYTLHAVSDLTITDSVFSSTDPVYQIFIVDDSSNILIENNYFYNSGQDISLAGIAIDFNSGVSGTEVKGNHFEDDGSGINYYDPVGSHEISGNYFLDMENYGISLQTADSGAEFAIDSNEFFWVDEDAGIGIQFTGWNADTTVSNNYIVGAENGFYFLGTSVSSEIDFDSNVVINSTNGFYTGSSEEEDLTFTSNRFCSSTDYDFYCDMMGDGNSGSGNFMDSIYSCALESESVCSSDVCTGEYIVPTCFEDTDGGLVLEDDGRLEDIDGNVIARDECLDGTHLLETYCDGNIPKGIVYECGKGCGGDMGDPYCVDLSGEPSSAGTVAGDIGGDTDGDDPLIDGYCGNRDVTLEDSCIDAEYLSESYCESDAIYTTYYQCTDVSYFPDDILQNTYSCSESSANGCRDSVDNDLDGLIDCADNDCNNLKCNPADDSYGCFENECVKIVLPDAELATVVVQEAYTGFLWSYSDLLDWLNSATVYHEEGVCNDICESYSQTCLFADAGRNTCEADASEKCTCI